MKVALAPSYRTWMLALLPTTFGVGTAALWLRSLSWPLSVDADGLTLRYHRRLPWASIKRIGISRSYLDGHVSEMRIHHRGGVSKIPVRGLRDGERVAGVILTMFKRTLKARTDEELRGTEPTPDITWFVGGDRLRIQDVPVARYPPARDTLVKIEAEIANVVARAREAMLEQAHRPRSLERSAESVAARTVVVGRDSQTMPARRHLASAAESRKGNERLTREFVGSEYGRRSSVLAEIGERT